MYLNNRTTGASCKNTVDVIATSISLYDPTDNGHYTDLNDVFVNKTQVISAQPNESAVFEYPDDQINNQNVSGLQSMIDYIRTHKPKPSFTYEDNSLTIVKKRVNASNKHFIFEDNQTLNKINKTINKTNKQYVFDDSHHYTIKKNFNKTKKQFFYDDNLFLNRTTNTTNNNSYKHYQTVTTQDHYNMTKHTTVNNRTTRIIPTYIYQDNCFYLTKGSEGYPKAYVDEWFVTTQNLINILSNRILTLENQYAELSNQVNPGSQY